jgi:hypothetical protein
VRVGGEGGNGAGAAGSLEADTTIIAGAVGAIDTAVWAHVGAVDQRDVVPEGVGDRVLELRDAVGPHKGRVLGDLEGLVAIETFGPGATGRDASLSVGRSAPRSVVSSAVVQDEASAAYRTVRS